MNCRICKSPTKLFLKELYDDRYGAKGFHNIYRCEKCGYGITSPGIKKQDIGKFYAKHYPLALYSADQVRKMANLPPMFASWLKGTDNMSHWYVKKDKKVLDIGSGSCLSLLEIQKLGGKAYGVEPDPNAQVIAKKLHLNVFQGFISDNPFPKVIFDYITASQVIEHDPDPIAFLKKAKDKLSENGEIILSFPNIDSIYRKIFGGKWLNWHIPYHLSFLTIKSLVLVTDKVGLKIRKIRTITPNLWTLMQLRMIISPITHGEVNPIWMTNAGNDDSLLAKNNFKIRFFKKMLPVFIFLFSFVNRIIDLVGLGDSYLVFLENEK